MTANLETIRQSVQSYFNTGWNNRTPIQWEQVPYEPTPGTSYVTVWITPHDAIQAELGSNPNFRVFGIVQVDINCPVGTGIKTLIGHADVVQGLFLGHQTTDGVVFRKMKIHKEIMKEWQRWCLSFSFYKDITT